MSWNKEQSKAWYEAHKESQKAKRKAYYQAHKEERKAWYEANKEQRKAYYQATKEQRKAAGKAYRQAHKEQRKAWREAHKEEKKAYYQAHKEERKAWYEAHKEQSNEYSKLYRKLDVNSFGETKNNIRQKSRYILKKSGIKIPDYEIHHCFTYDDPTKFIYCSKELHLTIHQFLRDNNIDADIDHYEQIKHLLDEKVITFGL